MLHILKTPDASAEEIMALDARLLENLDPHGPLILHLYRWATPSLTFGYFIDPSQHIALDQARKYGISWARRPTGGGVVFHLWDLAFSLLVPSAHPIFSLNTLDNYRFVNALVLESVKDFFSLKEDLDLIEASFPSSKECEHFCMARPTQYDVVYSGKKIAGAAQRRRKLGYLHQGTISLAHPDETILGDLLLSEQVAQAMLQYTFTPLGKGCSPDLLKTSREGIEACLMQKLRSRIL